MRVELLHPEPDLEFGNGGKCQDIRFGIGHYGAFDYTDEDGPRQIKLGLVGTDETLTALTEWLTRCEDEIPAKRSNQPRLYPPFPGFTTGHSFHSRLIWNPSEFRIVNIPTAIADLKNFNETVSKIADVYVNEIDQVIEKSGAHVVLCAPPLQHLRLTTFLAAEEDAEEATAPSDDQEGEDEVSNESIFDFHDLLKAKSLHLRTPLQLVLPATYDPSKNADQKKLLNRDQQDEATRAWNLLTALYYKARGIPWRMIRESAEVRTCYLGVSFFRTLDRERLYASSAQVFNERGEGVVVRGGLAYEDKEDRQVHLDSDGAYRLVALALEAFRSEHLHYPARVVIHKSSSFTDAEFEGFMRFMQEKGIGLVDCVHLNQSFIRLFRQANYPPLRGTLWHLEETKAIVYTRGSIPFYETYPGTYSPRTLYMDCNHSQKSVRELARECIALTKMNWNNTRFDGGLPITIRAAKQVGKILKYLEGENTTTGISPSYRFYM